MSRIARTDDGARFCSNCSSPVERDAKKCPSCDESLASEFEAVVCGSCGGLTEKGLEACPICGNPFKPKAQIITPKPVEAPQTKREDDFLLKLLEWGQGRKEETGETHEDAAEKEAAAKVLMNLGGEVKAGTKPYESPDAERLLDKDRSKPLGLDKPLEAAITTRQTLMNKLRTYLKEKQAALDAMGPAEDPELPKKMAKELRAFDAELERLEKIEASVENLRKTYTGLIIAQRDELERKDRDFNLRLNAFKKELARRTAEKKKMQEERLAVDAKEKDLVRRLKEVEGRESLFAKKEEVLKKQIADLQEQRRRAEASGAGVPSPGAPPLTQPPSDAKEAWMAENQRIQGDLVRLREEGAASGKLKADLEGQLTALREEREKLKKRLDEAVSLDGEVIEVLKVLDKLLENLPEDKVDEFARSPEFKKYEKVLERLGI